MHQSHLRPFAALLVLAALAGCGSDQTGPAAAPPATVAVGDRHVCTLDGNGGAWCWGEGLNGQLGGGTDPATAPPSPVSGDLRFSTLAAGSAHSCGLTADGTAWCWGSNRNGQLGAGALDSAETCQRGACVTTPIAVAGGLRFKTLAAGGDETCGITNDGAVWCWGLDAYGQLGVDAPATNCPDGPCALEPVAARSPALVSLSVSSTGHVCGLTNDGTAYCWGLNHLGALGIGRVGDTTALPTPVQTSDRFRLLNASGAHTCGVTTGNALYCWGIDVVPLHGIDHVEYLPIAVNDHHTFTALSGSRYSECGLTSDGTAFCWGINQSGVLGTEPAGSSVYVQTPVPVSGEHRFSLVAGGGGTACGVSLEGLLCWGAGAQGQLGSGTADRTSPGLVPLE